MSNTTLYKLLTVVGFSLFALSIGQIVLADWTAPTNSPPACPSGQPGCDAPINVGSATQIKNGGFIANVIRSFTSLTVDQGITTGGDIYLTKSDTTYGPWIGTGYPAGTPANTPLRLGTNGAERVRITGGGNVGIGTAAPSTKLEVAGALKGIDFLDIVKQSGGGQPSIRFEAGNDSWWHIVNEPQNLVFYTGAFGTGARKVDFSAGGKITAVDDVCTQLNGGKCLSQMGSGSGGGDNLGNHTATQSLNMAGFDIGSARNLNLSGTANVGSALNVGVNGVTTSRYCIGGDCATGGWPHYTKRTCSWPSGGNGNRDVQCSCAGNEVVVSVGAKCDASGVPGAISKLGGIGGAYAEVTCENGSRLYWIDVLCVTNTSVAQVQQ